MATNSQTSITMQRSLLFLLGLLIVSLVIIGNWYHQQPLEKPASEMTASIPINLPHLPKLANAHAPNTPAHLAVEKPPAINLLAPTPTTQKPTVYEIRIKPHQTITHLFHDLHIPYQQLHALLKLPHTKYALTHLHPQQKITLTLSAAGKLSQLLTQMDNIQTLTVNANGQGFQEKITTIPLPVKKIAATATIKHSLASAFKHNNLPESMMIHLRKIFAEKLNFARDIRAGDKVDIIYNRYDLGHGHFRYGPILAAQFITHKGTFTAVGLAEHGEYHYYDPHGHSLKTSFLRFPLHYTRIASTFSLHRWHPILHIWRAHLGIDLDAPSGSPIYAVAAGKIIFRGHQHGYGNVVVIDHGRGITTLYAHMARFKPGEHLDMQVKQGQVIGYVGESGLATGPHCHFEFRENGQHLNPATVKLPGGLPLSGHTLHTFLTMEKPLLAQLKS
ncbi:MAG: peptidoglycan DD-metalloendopeptidase family protein [Legionellales bacterium]|nr:peptidoglycan DD-metalloendopeptidase family protein [Legionellales bacterium]